MTVNNGTAVDILLVQDDPAEALLLADELVTHKVVNKVQAAYDAPTALAYLNGTSPFGRPGTPDLVLLDVKLPGRDGRVILDRLRTLPAAQEVPVILLTDSPEAERILRQEQLPVQGYVAKPVDFACLMTIVRSIDSLGLQVLKSLDH
ncbi:response regulator [Paractinoplanes atraurantiacus]|uniref:Response regulator receiver domain-containing protein n=1 Tax=Paractinoplanes atraurantiacus TaxID=1036182 RepID=A0A285GPE7_9ACTN|nr:response regulator [Actinoplanes atraurantiacus]SNY25439.1 Response regulator receiver domain-containing protein [Actinoplanes atraurantiacus]